jgi:hypothetical protein
MKVEVNENGHCVVVDATGHVIKDYGQDNETVQLVASAYAKAFTPPAIEESSVEE